MSDALVALEGAIDRIPAALQARSLGAILGKVNERTTEALRHAQRCKALVEMAEVLGGLVDAHVRGSALDVVEQAFEIGASLAAAKDAGDLEVILDDYANLPSALGKLDQSVRLLWVQKAKSDYASLIPVGELLGRIAGAENLGSKLVDVGRKAEALSVRSQAIETLAPEIAQLKSSREVLLADLKAFTSNPDVDRFLAGVTDGGASLELVTPAVLAWLADHGALAAFKVSG